MRGSGLGIEREISVQLRPPPERLPIALAAAAPLAFGVTVVTELTRVTGAPTFGALGELTVGLFLTSSLSLCLLLGQIAALLWWRRRPRHRSAALSVFLLSVAQGAVILARLVADTEVANHSLLWWVTLGFGALQGLALVGVGTWPRTRVAAIVLFTLAAPVAYYLNYLRGGSFYLPSDALPLVIFVALDTALALGASEAFPLRGVVAAGAAVALLLVGSLFADARTDARRAVHLHTAVGRTAGVRRALETHGPRIRPWSVAARTLAPDEDGLARFAEGSGLPPLSEDFALADHDVVLILVESFRYDETSLADPALDTTPNLADLAARGITFSRASSPSNATFPSLAALLAMRTPSMTPLDVPPAYWTGRLREEGLVAPEIFAAIGYESFWVGHDFNGVFGTALLGIRRRFETVDLVHAAVDSDSEEDREIADRAIAAIERYRAAGQRFFGLIFLSAPHDEYRAHQPDAPANTPLDLYREELRFMDAHLGRILDALRRDGGDAHTVVIVSGDHGEAFGEHGFQHHSTTMRRAQIHVPLVIAGPTIAPARVERPTAAHFVLPWLLLRGPERAAAEARRVIREDHGPLLRETAGAIISEMVSLRHQRAALRYPEHDVIYDLYTDVLRVYDVREDPAERSDLAAAHSDVAARYRPLAEGYREARFAGQRFRFTPPVPTRRGPLDALVYE